MRSVHVGVGHDDDPPVAQLAEIERALLVAFADAGAHRGDHGLDFGVLEHLVQTRFLHVDQLAADRQDGLEAAVAPLLGRAAGRVALDDEKFGQGRITLGTVGQFAGQAAAGQRALAHRLAGFARRLAGAGRGDGLFENLFRNGRVGLEEIHQPLVDDRADNAVDLGVDQFDLGLALELRVGVFEAEDADQTLAHVVAGDDRILVFDQIVGLCVLIDCAGQRRSEPGNVRASVRVRDRIGEAEDLVGVAVVVLQHAIDQDIFLDVLAVLVLHLGLSRAGQLDHLRVKNRLAFAQFLDEFLDAELVDKKGLSRLALDTFVGQADL